MPLPEHVALACAFNENAIDALGQWSSRHGVLGRRYVAGGVGQTAQAVLRSLPVKPPDLIAQADRWAARQRSRELPADVRTSVLSEPLRILGGRFRTPASHRLGNDVWKEVFDRATARHLTPGADVLVGQLGSSLHTFRAASDELTVLHVTDSHPRIRNSTLDHYYGRRAVAEKYPQRLVERIEAEMSRAQRVLVPSSLVRKQLTDLGVSDKKIIQVPYGVNLSRFGSSTSTASFSRQPSVSSARRTRVIYVGQVSLRKGIPFLFQALKGLPVDLTIVGNVFDRRIVQSMPENVEVLGAVPPDVLAKYYQETDALVLPTLDDAYGLVVLEALAAGVPVLTTSAAGAAELLDDRHVVVEPGNVEELRAALRGLRRPTPEDRQEIAASVDTIALPDGRRMSPDWDSYALEVMTQLGDVLAERVPKTI